VIWPYMSEVVPTRVRAKGQTVGTSTLWVMNALISALFLVLAARSSATPFFFFGAMMFLDVILIAAIYPHDRSLVGVAGTETGSGRVTSGLEGRP
jgi:SP family arabinose:H+ symporter-like MFS transporter